MDDTEGYIVAMGGGGFSMEPENSLLDDYVLALTGKPKPRVCFVPTASGDADRYIDRFRFCFRENRCVPTHLGLFNREVKDVAEFLLEQDVIYVGGGNTANMLAVWRIHGVDHALREAWRRGTVLCGISAGAICWFETGCTDSFGPLAPLHDGLGLLSGSACPHYDGEVDRRPAYHRFIAEGLPAGYAMDDGAAVVFRSKTFIEAVSSRATAKAYRVRRNANTVIEENLPTRFLGSIAAPYNTSSCFE